MRFAQDAAHRVSRDQQFLIGGNYVGGQPGTFRADDSLPANRFLVLVFIERQSCPGKPFADARAIVDEFSPMPPVNTMASAPPMAARNAPIYLRARWQKISMARRARRSSWSANSP